LRVELDLRNEKINYKVREHSLAKIRRFSLSARRKPKRIRCRSGASEATNKR